MGTLLGGLGDAGVSTDRRSFHFIPFPPTHLSCTLMSNRAFSIPVSSRSPCALWREAEIRVSHVHRIQPATPLLARCGTSESLSTRHESGH
eukprot:scaffold878_cov271-Pinguiococcus_pyrenoidosus.AAC.24